MYKPALSKGAPSLSLSNPYLENPKGDYSWGTMHSLAESVLERKWKTYFGSSSTNFSPGGCLKDSWFLVIDDD